MNPVSKQLDVAHDTLCNYAWKPEGYLAFEPALFGRIAAIFCIGYTGGPYTRKLRAPVCRAILPIYVILG